jgi:beta-aspartyl-peptidase (threonine type)
VNPAIIVHGGAGAWKKRGGQLPEAVAGCAAAAAAGQAILLAGGSALDAVEGAVRVLEDCPVTDAGRGSFLNAAGEIEMDAFIMDGQTLSVGAVGAVRLVQYPISLARRVMTDTEHNFLVGPGAEAFADQIGFPRCTMADLLTDEELARYRALLQEETYATVNVFIEPDSMGTVGAAAIDQQGHLAAATSTGGTRKKLPGRIGDTPIAGAGGYADNLTAAVSATGHGESLMKVLASKQVCDYVGQGLPAGMACEFTIRLLAERVDGHGGVIAVDRFGRTGFAYNTDAMPYAFAHGDRPVISGPEQI